jgi:hypothetical protein
MPKQKHKQVEADYMGYSILVDDKVLPLLRILWDNDIKTYNSCQDNNGTIWIEFKHISDLQSIIRKAFLKNHIINLGSDKIDEWRLYEFFIEMCDIRMNVDDNGFLDRDNNEWIEGDDINFSTSLRFNKEYLTAFIKSLKKVFKEKT